MDILRWAGSWRALTGMCTEQRTVGDRPASSTAHSSGWHQTARLRRCMTLPEPTLVQLVAYGKRPTETSMAPQWVRTSALAESSMERCFASHPMAPLRLYTHSTVQTAAS